MNALRNSIFIIFVSAITNFNALSENTHLKSSPVGDALSPFADSSAIGIGDSPSSIGLSYFMKKYIVYKITNTINSKLYIGATSKTKEIRLKEHKFRAKRNKSNEDRRSKLYRAMRKYGCDNFAIEMISEWNTEQDMFLAEKKEIIEYKSIKYGYNTSPGGVGGNIKTKEQLQKQSIEWSKNNPFKNLSKEEQNNAMAKAKITREKWLNSEDGLKHREMHRQRWLTNNPGKNKTKATINKISQNKKGKISSCGIWLITDPNGNSFEIENLSMFCRENNLNSGNIVSKWGCKKFTAKKIKNLSTKCIESINNSGGYKYKTVHIDLTKCKPIYINEKKISCVINLIERGWSNPKIHKETGYSNSFIIKCRNNKQNKIKD